MSVVAYLGLLAVWPYLLVRYVAPVVPLLVLTLLAGVSWIGERVAGPRTAVLVTWTLSAILAAGALREDLDRLRLVSRCDRESPYSSAGCFSAEQRSYFAAAAAARQLAPDSSLFIASAPATFYLLSGHRAVAEAEAVAAREPDAFDQLIRRRGVEFILLSHISLQQWGLAPALRARCRDFAVAGTFGAHVALLRVSDVDPGVRTADATTNACAAVARWADEAWAERTTLIW